MIDIESHIETKREELYDIALNYQEQYWDEWRKLNEGLTGKDRGYCGVFTRLNKGSLEIHWKRYTPTKDKATKKNFTTYIKRGRKDSYTNRTLASASKVDWETALMIRYEEKFSVLRKASRLLTELGQKNTQLKAVFTKIDSGEI